MDKKLLYEINRFREISGLGLIKEQRKEITTSIELKNYLDDEEYELIKKELEILIIPDDNMEKSKTIKCGRTKTVKVKVGEGIMSANIEVELSLECDTNELVMMTKGSGTAFPAARGVSNKSIKIMLTQSTAIMMETAQIKINGESPSNFQITTTVGDLLKGKKFEPITISPKDLYGPEILDTNTDVTIYHDNSAIKIPNKDFGYRDNVNNNTYYFVR